MQLTRKEFEESVGKELKFKELPGKIILATADNNIDSIDKYDMSVDNGFELFQVFDENNEPYRIDGHIVVVCREECHGSKRLPNLYHRTVGAFIVNSEMRLLVPIRADDKDMYPNLADVSVAEHLKVRESYMDALVRGFKEEQGITIQPQQLAFLFGMTITDPNQLQICEYYLFYDDDGKDYDLSSESSSQRWIPLSDLNNNARVDNLNFRPDLMPALKRFLEDYVGKKNKFNNMIENLRSS